MLKESLNLTRLEKLFMPEPNSGCWIWLGPYWGGGYGSFVYRKGHGIQAHRAVWQFYNGPIPEKKTLDHLCRNRWCVNPQHCEPVSQRENVLRGVNIAAVRATATHCENGHEFTEENVYRWGTIRQCRTCRKNRENNRDRTKKAEYLRQWRSKQRSEYANTV